MTAPEKVVSGGCTIFRGDCLDVLATLPAESVDAVVTDPPSGISFMSKAWDSDKGGRDHWIAWMSRVAAECLRVAKPGAHALVWALPRTSHWTATAWEDAGWDVRDRVSHLFGTGFPKSLDVSKAIDKAAGAERVEIVGSKLGRPGMARDGGNQRNGFDHAFGGEKSAAPMDHNVYAPATPEAARWAGWGTALKPAVEDWWLLRKPLACPTVAAQVLETGTGALNVDACRVATDWSTDPTRRGWQGRNLSHDGGSVQFVDHDKHLSQPNAAGRWPANLCWSVPEDEYILREDVTPQQKRELYGWLSENA